jgi:hypothetical protein
MVKVSIGIAIGFIVSYMVIIPAVFAQNPPASGNYKVLEYGFGSGGVASASSNGYSLFGTLGQVDQGSPASALYFIGAGLEYEIMASAPAAPIFVNPSNYYNKLHITVNRGGADPSDYEYAIAISASDAAHFEFLRPDQTLGEELTDENWQSYSSWGGASGTDIIGLIPGSTYYARVAARHGKYFTQSWWSPISTAATVNPSLSFDIDVSGSDTETSPPYVLNVGNLPPDTVTTSSERVWIDITTNGTSGGFVSVSGSNSGLTSSSVSHTINSATADLTAQPSGYGAQYASTGQTSGGPMEALSPYDGSSNNVGVLDTAKRYMFDSSDAPVTGGRVSFRIKAKATNTTPSASDYADILTILATGSF